MHLRSRAAVLSAATLLGAALAGGTAFAATNGPTAGPAIHSQADVAETPNTGVDAPGGPDLNVQSGSQSTTGVDNEAATKGADAPGGPNLNVQSGSQSTTGVDNEVAGAGA